MLNCTHMFTALVADLAQAVHASEHLEGTHPAVLQGIETRKRIADALRQHGPMTVAETARKIDRTRACVNLHMLRMATEKPPRVRRQSDGYNAKWELA